MNFMEKLTQKQKEELHQNIRSEEDVLAVRRSQAIILLEDRATADVIKSITGYQRAVAVKIRKRYIKDGFESLKSKRADKQVKSLLTKKQKKQIIEVLNTATPQEFGYSTPFWTTRILGNLIELNYGVRYKSKTSLYLIFKQAKFTFHKPEKVSEKRDEKQIAQWKQEQLPELEKECRREDTIVLVGDEASLTSQTRTQHAWLPANTKAFVEDTTKRKRIHLYGFLNIQNGEAIAYKTEQQTGKVTVSILKKIAKRYPHNRIVIIWDNARWHKSTSVREYLEKTDQFKLYNFPPYAPDLNPQEHVWKEMRDKILNNKLIPEIKAAANKAVDFINNSIFKYKFFGLHGTF